MSDLSKLEKRYEQLKKKAYEAEADFALSHIMDEAGVNDSGDYLLGLGTDNRWGEAAVFRIRKKLWGTKSYHFGLFPQGRDHDVFVDTQGMAPISSVPVGFGKWDIYPCPAKYASAVKEWIKAEKENI